MSALDHRLVGRAGGGHRAARDAAPVQGTTPRVPARDAVASIAEFTLIAGVTFAVLAVSEISFAILPETALASTVWFVSLRRVYTSTWLPPVVLGVPAMSIAGAAVGLAGVSAAATLIPALDVDAPQVLVMAGAIAIASSIYEFVVMRRVGRRRRLLVVGSQPDGVDLAAELRAHPELHFDCIGVVDSESAFPSFREVAERFPATIERERPDLVVLADVSDRKRAIEQLLDAASCPVECVDAYDFYEHAFGRVPIQNLSPEWFMGVLRLYHRRYSRFSKRAFDLSIAAVALVVVAPLLAIVALVVRLSGPGPVLFRQVRLGEAGQPFEIIKFRTMVADAERDGVAVWALKDDPRVTRAGRVLRRTRLDELPQLWNVLVGEMSIVGPRPERPEFLERLAQEVPFWTRRHLVKPGVTGWAQLQCGYTSDALGAADKLSYDLYYLKHRSLLLDLAITARTAAIVVTGAGAQ